MPAKKRPTLSAEDCDLLADCISIAEMTGHLTTEQAKHLKGFVLALRPHERHRPPSELEPFLPMLEAHIQHLGNVSESCREVARIVGVDPRRLRNLFYARRRGKLF